MRKFALRHVAACTLVSLILFQSCKDDSHLATAPPVPDQSFSEEFDTTASALARGWRFFNVSEEKGSNVWQQGGNVIPWFPAYSNKGTYAGFIGADYTSTNAAQAIISNWVVSPPVTFQNGDKIVFYTRAWLDDLTPFGIPGDSTDWSNRMQLRANLNNESLNIGNAGDPGDFTTILVDINPNYDEYRVNPALRSPFAYPARWTRFEGTISGLNNPVRGRFAFRYFLEGGGNNGLGSGVGLDNVEFISVSR